MKNVRKPHPDTRRYTPNAIPPEQVPVSGLIGPTAAGATEQTTEKNRQKELLPALRTTPRTKGGPDVNTVWDRIRDRARAAAEAAEATPPKRDRSRDGQRALPGRLCVMSLPEHAGKWNTTASSGRAEELQRALHGLPPNTGAKDND